MSLPLIFRPTARAEFDAAADWYEHQRAGLGARFTAAVEVVLDRIGEQPDFYPVVFEDIREASVKTYPYCVYYRVRTGYVSMIRSSTRPAIQQFGRVECNRVREPTPETIPRLRDMARQGDSVAMMFDELKVRLGSNFIVPIIECMRAAFYLSLQDAKPIAALTRTEQREVMDEALLNELVMPAIEKHRSEWDT